MPGESFPVLVVAAFLAGGYLLGSVSFALLFGRLRGMDLRTYGSGNLGATNAGRALGRRLGLLVFLLDAVKGFLPAFAGVRLHPSEPWVAVAAGGGAVLGHVFPFYLGFRGGKGVATLSGALLALAPLAMLLAAAPFALAVVLSRFMSLGSLVLGVALPLAVWAAPGLGLREEPYSRAVQVFAVLAGLLVIITHRSNIGRLLAGKEARIGSGRKREP